jgi:hypothetical protein
MNSFKHIVLLNIPIFLLLISLSVTVNANPTQEGFIELSYSNGTGSTYGLENINKVLREIGVRVSSIPIPDEAASLLNISPHRALSQAEADKLISIFYLDRDSLLDEINNAGRLSAVKYGGDLSTSEVGVAPYPKVYDMKALDVETTTYLQSKFGKLHVNSADNGIGIDEVMTIVSGGPYTWFFVLPNGVVGKLRFGKINEGQHAWRISYPGKVPHGGFFNAPFGLVVAFAHGPEHFVMRYEDPSVNNAETLGGNPWIDFSQHPPLLLN